VLPSFNRQRWSEPRVSNCLVPEKHRFQSRRLSIGRQPQQHVERRRWPWWQALLETTTGRRWWSQYHGLPATVGWGDAQTFCYFGRIPLVEGCRYWVPQDTVVAQSANVVTAAFFFRIRNKSSFGVCVS